MSEKHITNFQVRRWFMMFGLMAAVLGIIFFLLNNQFNFVSEAFNKPVSLSGLGISMIAYLLYRCPVCGKAPEDEDVFKFNPNICANCGSKLK